MALPLLLASTFFSWDKLRLCHIILTAYSRGLRAGRSADAGSGHDCQHRSQRLQQAMIERSSTSWTPNINSYRDPGLDRGKETLESRSISLVKLRQFCWTAKPRDTRVRWQLASTLWLRLWKESWHVSCLLDAARVVRLDVATRSSLTATCHARLSP